jgi:hypothetical protein
MSTKATAALIYEYGEPDVFRFETMDVPDPVVSGRVSELEQKKIFSQCSREKPCWLTEWGIPNGQSCPINDANRANVIEAERDAFKPFVQQGQLAAIIYYTWSGTPTKVDPMGIYRCGALTEAGKAALSP